MHLQNEFRSAANGENLSIMYFRTAINQMNSSETSIIPIDQYTSKPMYDKLEGEWIWATDF